MEKELTLRWLCEEAHRNAAEHGFYDADDLLANAGDYHLPPEAVEVLQAQSKAAKLNQMVSELAKATEAARINDMQAFKGHMVDLFIRAAGMCGWLGVEDIDAAVKERMAYNATRPHKHGKLF